MINEAIGVENEVTFKFYTYHHTGREVVIPIFAKDEAEAWEKFDCEYGENTLVDMMIRG